MFASYLVQYSLPDLDIRLGDSHPPSHTINLVIVIAHLVSQLVDTYSLEEFWI